LSYANIGFFFVFVFFLAMMFRIGVHLHAFSQTRLDNPTLPFQLTISLSLIGSLYTIVRLRHERGVWKLLRWSWPARLHLVAALVGGIGLGTPTAIYNVTLFLWQALQTTEADPIGSRLILDLRGSPRRALFDRLEHVIDCL